MRPIDANKIENDLEYYISHTIGNTNENYAYNRCMCLIKQQPTIEPYGTWIPCSERLPEEIQMFERGDDVTPVIVTFLSYYEKEPMCTILAIYCEDGKWRWYDDNGYVSQMETVKVPIIAWMPLPEPWKGDEL